MSQNATFVARILSLVREKYPGWEHVNDPRFMADEVGYKEAAAQEAKELLSEDTFRALLAAGNTSTIIEHLRSLGHKTNVLWNNVPRQGDLAPLYREGLDERILCEAFFDLLYGSDAITDRVQRYLDYASNQSLPRSWTFPSYFLFLFHPQSEIFVKPEATRRVLREIGAPLELGEASGKNYAQLRSFAHEVRTAMKSYGVTSMIHVQSFIWVSHIVLKEREKQTERLTPKARKTLEALIKEFDETYLSQPKGQDHAAHYETAFEEAEANLDLIREKTERGDDITDLVFDSFLPYPRTEKNLAAGRWTHPARMLYADIRAFMKKQGYYKSEDWPQVAAEIFALVNTCAAHPAKLADAISRFTASDYCKGFQTATLTPILNALHPDHFLIINSKPQQLINHLAETNYNTQLTDYPDLNAKGFEVVEALAPLLEPVNTMEAHRTVLFDMFCFWLFSEKEGYTLGNELKGALRVPKHPATKPTMNKLAEPFNRIFADWEQAQWGFDFFKETAEALGIKHPQDERFSFSVPKEFDGSLMRLGMGNRIVLDIHGDIGRKNHQTVHMLVLTSEAKALGLRSWNREEPAENVEMYVYDLENQEVRPMPEALREAFDMTLEHAREEFGSNRAGKMRTTHLEILAEAVFDLEVREAILTHGLDWMIDTSYPLSKCAEETGFDEDTLGRWVRAINRKGQAVFYGPPGTGKTFLAQKLARHLVGGGDGLVELVQFHSAYAYEDFIQGLRPQRTESGDLDYPLVKGRFLRFCEAASLCEGTSVLIIDELNRANLARVFGELMYLLEYRGEAVPLASGGMLRIPDNVRILGTMNTADRSIALVDHALRRRFAFINLPPNYEILRRFQEQRGQGALAGVLIEVMKTLNEEIGDPHFELGISFFLIEDLDEHLEEVWCMEIEPYLEEYFHAQRSVVAKYRWDMVREHLQV